MKNYVSYNSLWKLLIDKNLNKQELSKMSGVSPSTLSKMSKNEMVAMPVLVKICNSLHCDIGDIVHIAI